MKTNNEQPNLTEQLIIPSDQTFLPKVEKFLIAISKRANLNEDQSDNLAIAVTELVNNGIIHANQFDAKKTVTITAKFGKKQLTVSVTDQGSGFEPQEVADPTDPQNIGKFGGRGIYIVRELIKDVSFHPTPHGTTVTLTIPLEDTTK
jgi:serine/threonine-protein kinase RsbW